ncbi:hypothetical protein [Mycolicibacterium komossense]|uniref:Uncharacterized protein n=1 Tax=Mycolicibacterium komossense TaxID=1779 RepID=A0ABT3CAL2_9MYCO|nr:hypothetical protein [Mycolicibacterium komossense]MCV7226490.1 hypothetical protein [Mycolicibacterium komossense]
MAPDVVDGADQIPPRGPAGARTASTWLDTAQTLGLSESEVVAKARLAVAMAFSDAQPDFTRISETEVALIASVPGHYAATRQARDARPARARRRRLPHSLGDRGCPPGR